MRVLLMLVMSSLLAFSPADAVAARNPLIRVCVTSGGQFQVEPRGHDDIALCRFDLAVIDSQTLLSRESGGTSAAAAAILQDRGGTTCADVAASNFQISTGESLCLFGDGSALGFHVVRAGLSDTSRLRLKEVLFGR